MHSMIDQLLSLFEDYGLLEFAALIVGMVILFLILCHCVLTLRYCAELALDPHTRAMLIPRILYNPWTLYVLALGLVVLSIVYYPNAIMIAVVFKILAMVRILFTTDHNFSLETDDNLSEEHKDAINKFYDYLLFAGPVSWLTYNPAMRKYSKIHPTVVFTLSIKVKDADYYLHRQYLNGKAKDVFPDAQTIDE